MDTVFGDFEETTDPRAKLREIQAKSGWSEVVQLLPGLSDTDFKTYLRWSYSNRAAFWSIEAWKAIIQTEIDLRSLK